MKKSKIIQGVGLGLRWDFVDELLDGLPPLDFVEISPENYMGRGGYYREALARARAAYPIVTHGLTMSLGGFDPLGEEYLAGLAAFLDEVESPWHSDHLCFSLAEGRVLHDLLPLAFTEATAQRVAERIRRAEDAIGRPMAVENVSFYMHPGKKEMSEPEFITRVCELADCKLMLDVNNAYVNSVNFGFDVDEWMAGVPLHRVVQMHVAGHDWFHDEGGPGAAHGARHGQSGKLIVDTHGADVCDPVLALLERVLEQTGPVPVLLERDQAVPPLPELLAEVSKIKELWARATGRSRPRRAASAPTAEVR
jgi:uncharacterized protein (UPF0276 family)